MCLTMTYPAMLPNRDIMSVQAKDSQEIIEGILDKYILSVLSMFI